MNKQSSTADRLIDCSRALIVSGGYNGFSYADIAAVVGIRKPSIHHHFPSKAALVSSLVARHLDHTVQGLEQLARTVPAPLDQLRCYVDHWQACIADASAPFCVCALLASELPMLPPDVARQVRAYFRFLSAWLAGLLERGAQQGAIRLTQSPQTEAEVFMATVHGAMLSARAYGDPHIFGAIMAPQLERLSAPQPVKGH